MSVCKDCSLNALCTTLAQHFVLLSDYSCVSPTQVELKRVTDPPGMGGGESTRKCGF